MFSPRFMDKGAEKSRWAERRADLLAAERYVGPAPSRGPLPVAVCFPGTYKSAMAGLGFQLVWKEAAYHQSFNAERVFFTIYDQEPRKPDMPKSLESGRPIGFFEALFFSLQYELDYMKFYTMLLAGGLNPLSAERRPGDPLIVVGGIAVTANPEPVAPFADVLYLGDSEAGFADVLDMLAWTRGAPKAEKLPELDGFPGVYVPSFSPEPPARAYAKSLNGFPATSSLVTPNAEFGDALLLEPVRGCPRKCKFCLIGNTCGGVRTRPYMDLAVTVYKVKDKTGKVALVGSSLSDYPGIEELVGLLADEGFLVSVSSLNLASVTDRLLNVLGRSGQRSVTFAPEAATAVLREAVGKPLPDGRLEEVMAISQEAGFRSVKLYYMVGLPGETDADARAIGGEVANLAGKFPRLRFHVSLSPFVPKSGTPWADEPVTPPKIIRTRFRMVRGALKGATELSGTSAGEAQVQALLSLGDGRAARFIAARAVANRYYSVLSPEEEELLDGFRTKHAPG